MPVATSDEAATEGPLSHAQSRFLLSEQLWPGRSDNQIMTAYLLTGPLDVEALRAAFDDVTRRHPALRTVYGWDASGTPVQRVLPPAQAPRLVPVPAPAGGDGDFLSAARVVAAPWWDTPFELEEEVPVRAALAPLTPGRHLLLLNVHHIAFDGRSEVIVLDDLAEAYRARLVGTRWSPEVPPSYLDFVRWERAGLPGWTERELPFWRSRLPARPPMMPVPERAEADRDAHRVRLDAQRVRALTAAARARGALPWSALLCSVADVLGRTYGVPSVPVGTILATRFDPRFRSMVGCLVNPIVVTLDADPSRPYGERLREAARVTIEALRHARTPYDELVRLLGRTERMPIFQAWAALHDPPPGGELASGVGLERIIVPAPRMTSNVVVDVEPGRDGSWSLASRWRVDGLGHADGREMLDGIAASLLACAAEAP